MILTLSWYWSSRGNSKKYCKRTKCLLVAKFWEIDGKNAFLQCIYFFWMDLRKNAMKMRFFSIQKNKYIYLSWNFFQLNSVYVFVSSCGKRGEEEGRESRLWRMLLSSPRSNLWFARLKNLFSQSWIFFPGKIECKEIFLPWFFQK